MRTTLCLLLTITVVSSFPNFQTLIPNGRKVPNPCSATGGVWPGVGHLRVTGSGPTNPFGEAFRLAGHVWDKVLCEKDSDGDGKTNGEELGDPQCLFTPGTNPQLTAPIGHPDVTDPHSLAMYYCTRGQSSSSIVTVNQGSTLFGICEPVGGTQCASQNFTCSV